MDEIYTITCRSCSRRLVGLRAPSCPWCGATIAAEDYAPIAELSQPGIRLPEQPSLPSVNPYYQDYRQSMAGWDQSSLWSLFLPRSLRMFQPLTQGQARLRLLIYVVFGLMAAAGIARSLYAIYLMQRVIHLLPPH